MLHMLQLFQRHAASVCFECFRCFKVCFICVFRTHVASYLDVAYVSHIRCMCFIGCLCMVAMVFKCFSGVFSSVSKACFKCFNCLQTYVATVVFGCLKTRSGVAFLLPSLPGLAGHPYDAAAGFFRIGGAARPSPLVARVARAPRGA
jgi:hypothetical protein